MRASSFALFAFLAATLSAHDLGLVAGVLLIFSSFDSLFSTGTGQVIQTLGGGIDEDRATMGIAIISGALPAVIMAALAHPVTSLLAIPSAESLVQTVSPVLVLTRWAEARRGLLERGFDYKVPAMIDGGSSLVALATAGFAANSGAGAGSVVVYLWAAHGLSAVLYLAAPVPGRSPISREYPTVWRYVRPLLGSSLAVYAFNNVDDALVSRLGGAAALGIYSFAYKVSNAAVYLVSHGTNRLLLPELAASGDLAIQRKSFLRIIRLAAWSGGSISISLAFFGSTIVSHYYQSELGYQTGQLIPILAVYGLVRGVASSSGSVFIAKKQAHMIRRIAALQAVIMSVLLMYVYPRAGLIGAAAAVTAVMTMGGLAALSLAAPMLGVSRKVLCYEIVGPWIVIAIPCAGLRWLIEYSTVVPTGPGSVIAAFLVALMGLAISLRGFATSTKDR